MNISRVLKYLFSSALRSFRHSWVIQFVAAGTLSTAFFILGGALVLFQNVKDSLTGSKGNLHISVYFRDGAGPYTAKSILDTSCSGPLIRRCTYVSSDEAREKFVARTPDLKNSVSSLDGNPFPASLEIELNPAERDRQKIKNLSRRLASLEGVELVDDGWAWLDRWLTILAVADWAMGLLGLALAGAMVFVVSNTIKLIVYARRDEVEILNLVGASPWMIRTPFLIEGMLQGVLGGTIALAGLYLFFVYVRSQMAMQFDVGSILSEFSFLSWQHQAALLVLGAAMGMLGSAFAVGRFLRT